MKTDFEIVRYSKTFKDQVVALTTHLWSSNTGLNAAYFEWKHEQNPYIEEPLVWLALHQGEVVGMRGVFGSKWEIGSPDETFTFPHADDLVVRPDFRNQGVVTQIHRAAFEDLERMKFPYIVSLSAGPLTVLGSLAMGWKRVGLMTPYSKKNSIHKLSKTAPYSLFGRVLGIYENYLSRTAFDRLDHKSHSRTNASISIGSQPRSEEMSRLLNRIPSNGRIRHLRNQEYFDWRFRNPLHRYRFLYWDETELEGYLVLQQNRKRREFNIVDWEGTTQQVQSELLDAAFRFSTFPEISCWTLSLSDESRTLLSKAGFRGRAPRSELDLDECLLVRPACEDSFTEDWTLNGVHMLDPQNWSIRMIFSMRG